MAPGCVVHRLFCNRLRKKEMNVRDIIGINVKDCLEVSSITLAFV